MKKEEKTPSQQKNKKGKKKIETLGFHSPQTSNQETPEHILWDNMALQQHPSENILQSHVVFFYQRERKKKMLN